MNTFPVCVMGEINHIINKVQVKEDKAKYRTHGRKFNKLINFRYAQQHEKNQLRLLNNHSMNQFINSNNIDDIETESNEIKSKIVWNLWDCELIEEN